MGVVAMALTFLGPLEWRHVIQQGPGPATAKPGIGDMESRDQDGGPSKLPLLPWVLIKLLSGILTPPLPRQQCNNTSARLCLGGVVQRARERARAGREESRGWGVGNQDEEGGEGKGEGRKGDGEEEKWEKRGSWWRKRWRE